MDNTSKTTRVETGKPGLAEVGAQLNEAQEALGQRLYESAVESQKQLAAVATAFAAERQKLDQETAKRAAEAATEYSKAAERASGQEKAQELLAEAYQNYVKTLEGLQIEGCRQLQNLYTEHTTKWTEAEDSAKKQTRQTYVDHLKRVQKAWASLDVESLVP
jgi:hypothetical protein